MKLGLGLSGLLDRQLVVVAVTAVVFAFFLSPKRKWVSRSSSKPTYFESCKKDDDKWLLQI
jgi:hypothetical protein